MAGRRETEHDLIHEAILKEGANRLNTGHALPPQEIRDIAACYGHYSGGLTTEHFLSYSATPRIRRYWGDIPVIEYPVTAKTFLIYSANIPLGETDAQEVANNLRNSMRASHTRSAVARKPSTLW